MPMLHADDIAAALMRAPPRRSSRGDPALAQALAEAARGVVNPAEAQVSLAANPELTQAFRALAGKEVKAGRAVISFDKAQLGDVTISGDVAGRDVIKLSFNLGVQQIINVSGQATVGKTVGAEKHGLHCAWKKDQMWLKFR